MSNFLNNTTDLEKILNEVSGIEDLIAQIKEALSGGSNDGGTSDSAPTLITFTIADTEFQAEDGMTWYEWVNSDYAPEDPGNSTFIFTCMGDEYSVENDNTDVILDEERTIVKGQDVIINHSNYTLGLNHNAPQE